MKHAVKSDLLAILERKKKMFWNHHILNSIQEILDNKFENAYNENMQ